MRRTSTGLLVLVLALAGGVFSNEWFGHAGHTDGLTLKLDARKTSLRVGEETDVRLVLKNEGRRSVRLVEPGDGSESGWRTPVVAWSIIKDDPAAPHPPEPFRGVRARECGNVGGLRWGEVFSLAPGETKELWQWGAFLPRFEEPGVYRVVFLYANRPSMSWVSEQGRPLVFNNPFEMWRVRHSTEATAVSNELVFTVRD
ncbi:MAG: hypothetical protein JOZ96_10320 [Acidobacteria bacterium]|nr:hypothetical protein [Acidobacteriota bacterium]